MEESYMMMVVPLLHTVSPICPVLVAVAQCLLLTSGPRKPSRFSGEHALGRGAAQFRGR